METAKTFRDIVSPAAMSFHEIAKFNPNHGKDGRFSGSGAATSFTYKPGASSQHDNAIAREKYRAANEEYQGLKKKYGGVDAGVHQTDDKRMFADSIKAAKESNPNGGSVDEHPIKELKTFKTFISENGMATVAVKPDGDITAVSKNSNFRQRGVVNDLILTARANGGTKMDCYGSGLVNMYEKCGYVPVSRVKFNPKYVTDPVLLRDKPDVYVMMKNKDSMETVVRKNTSHAYKTSTQDMLDKLPTFEYDKALSYRDGLLKKQEG